MFFCQVRGWINAIDLEKRQCVTLEEFIAVSASEKIGFTGNAAQLFNWLDYDYSGTLRLEELDLQAGRQSRKTAVPGIRFNFVLTRLCTTLSTTELEVRILRNTTEASRGVLYAFGVSAECVYTSKLALRP